MYDGLLGLYVDSEGVKVLPQENTFAPQAMFYTFFSINKNPVHALDIYCIHVIIKYLSMSHYAPCADIEDYGTTSPPKLSIVLQALLLHPFHTELPVISSVKTDLGIIKLALDENGKFRK